MKMIGAQHCLVVWLSGCLVVWLPWSMRLACYCLWMQRSLREQAPGHVGSTDRRTVSHAVLSRVQGDAWCSSARKPVLARLICELACALIPCSVLPQRMNDGKEVNIPASIRSRTLSRCIRSAVATGNWGTQPGAPPAKTGVSQVMNRLTYLSSLSHLRRCNTPLGSEGKQAKPRQLHNTQWGIVCPCESPEGGTIGLIKARTARCLVVWLSGFERDCCCVPCRTCP